MRLYIYTLDQVLYEGEADEVHLPGSGGEMTVLPHHAPLVTTLKSGEVIARHTSDKAKTWQIERGLVTIDHKSVIALIEPVKAKA